MKKILLLLITVCIISTATQAQIKNICGAMTTKQTACQIKVKKAGVKCFHHNTSTPKCTATTKAGARCKLNVKAGSLCHIHSK